MSSPGAPCCGYAPVGSDWGYLTGQRGPDSCRHVNGERRCESCSQEWYREGNASTHEYEMVGDPPRYVGGPASEDCPECVAADAADAPAKCGYCGELGCPGGCAKCEYGCADKTVGARCDGTGRQMDLCESCIEEHDRCAARAKRRDEAEALGDWLYDQAKDDRL